MRGSVQRPVARWQRGSNRVERGASRALHVPGPTERFGQTTAILHQEPLKAPLSPRDKKRKRFETYSNTQARAWRLSPRLMHRGPWRADNRPPHRQLCAGSALHDTSSGPAGAERPRGWSRTACEEAGIVGGTARGRNKGHQRLPFGRPRGMGQSIADALTRTGSKLARSAVDAQARRYRQHNNRRGPPTAPSTPIHPHPPSKPIVDGRFWALWAPSHFPAQTGLEALLSPERAGDTRLASPARPFLLMLARDRGGDSRCDWASIVSLPSARHANCSPHSCRSWHDMGGAGGGMTSDPGYPPTKLTVLVVFVT